jgi:hypothetical protein
MDPFNVPDFLSPFEEVVLTALLEIGPGVHHELLRHKIRILAQRDSMPCVRVCHALELLRKAGCIESWSKGPVSSSQHLEDRYYRILWRGERALEAAIRRRGSPPPPGYFRRAGRFGVFWDAVLAYRARKRAFDPA